MTPADATPAESPGDAPPSTPPSAAAASTPTPMQSAGWLLRSSSWVAAVAAIAGAILAPGVRGNASEAVVDATDRVANALAYFLALHLVAMVAYGAFCLLRDNALPAWLRTPLVGGGPIVVLALVFGALRDRLPPGFPVVISATATCAALSGALVAARTPHTRAAAGVLLSFAFASIARLAAWELAARAGDAASVQMFAFSRGLATAGVLFDASGQLVAVTWLGTRSRGAGQLGSTAALIGAFAVTWGVARGVHSGAALWQAIAHTALGDAAGIPQPYGLDALATFLVPASLLVAMAVAAQPKQEAVLLAVMTTALVSRGAFDAPLRALCAVAAAQWAALASFDGRAMWRTLLAERAQREKE
jgi:hypothetical protein